MRFTRLLPVALFGVLALPSSVGAASGTQSLMTPISGEGTGRVIVSSTAQDQGTFAVQITVNIHSAAPGTTFSIERAVDLTPDGVCSSSIWLTAPGAMLTTSPGGAGATHFEIHRGAPFVSGVQFDVRWRAVGTDGTQLRSECFTVTVK